MKLKDLRPADKFVFLDASNLERGYAPLWIVVAQSLGGTSILGMYNGSIVIKPAETEVFQIMM